MTRTWREGFSVLLAVFAVGATATPAAAGLLTRTGNDYAFIADQGVADAMSIAPGAAGRFRLTDSADTITLGTGTTGCVHTAGGTTTVDCPLANSLSANLGDFGDSVSTTDSIPMEFTLDGRDGVDSLDGGGFDDILIGGSGNDVLLAGAAGDDRIEPGLGTDLNVSGGTGIDILIFEDGRTSGVFVNLTAVPAIGPDGETFTGIEQVIGTSFNDTLAAPDATFAVALNGLGGDDTVVGGTQGDILSGADGDDTLFGAAGNDTLSGGANDDSLDGSAGADQLHGGAHDDVLSGGPGTDTMRGDSGADVLVGGADADVLHGNDSTGTSDGFVDTASYQERSTPVLTTLGGVHQDGDTYTDIQNLTGGSGNDTLVGDGGANVLVGLNGADTLVGGAGVDSLRGGATDGSPDSSIDVASYSDRSGGVVASLGGSNPDGDVYTDINGLEGGLGPDTLTGNGSANTLRGLGENDVLIGAGDADLLDGGAGTGDIASYENSVGGIDANLRTGSNFHDDDYLGIEGLRGGAGDDGLTGDGGPNMLDGGGGDDELMGGLGADVLIGGDGLNTASYQDDRPPAMGLPTGIYLNLNALPGPDGDTYSGISRFIGTNFEDDMRAGAGSVEFLTADGDDLVRTRGGATDDVNCGMGHDAVEASSSGDTTEECEVVQLGEAGVGVADVSVLEGNAGPTLVSFTLALEQAIAYPATVSYETRDGTAVAPSDYASVSGNVTFATGDRTATVNVTVNGDGLVEPDETFSLALLAFVGGDILAGEATATIANDDAAPVPAAVPLLTISNARVKEGNRGTKAMKFLVRLSAASATPVTVRFKTQKGTAKPRSDFVGRSLLLTFAPGQTEIIVAVKVKGDRRDERNEKFSAVLSGATGAAMLDALGVGTIRDND